MALGIPPREVPGQAGQSVSSGSLIVDRGDFDAVSVIDGGPLGTACAPSRARVTPEPVADAAPKPPSAGPPAAAGPGATPRPGAMEHGAARWLDASESPSEPLRGRPADSGAGGGEPRCGFWPRAAVGGVGVLVLLLAALAACLPFAWREGDQTPGRSVAGETPVERLERQLRLLLDEQRLLRERSPAALGDERQLRQHPPGESEKRLAPLIEQVEETIRELRGHSGGTHSTPSTTLEGGGHKFTLHMFDDEEDDSTSTSDSENADQHQDCSRCSQATEVTTTTTASPTTTTGCTTPQPTLVAGCPCTGDQEEPSEPTSGISWAYVTMAYDPPGSGEERLLAVLALARALQQLSAYPLLVLTNATEFSDGSPVRESLQLVNAVVMPLLEVELPPHYKFDFDHWRYAYWKLQIWTLTDYEKLIWLDADSILYRSVDWLFQESWMWAQRDDWFCVGEQNAMCSGIMLLFPSVDDYNGLLDYASSADMPKGDQQLIWEGVDGFLPRPVARGWFLERRGRLFWPVPRQIHVTVQQP
ncbi:unnamed protein product [Prorocentrum cordatum]|uniref:Hexosyltransferase n=1 Tax=Prorocentrum cordatum TaxID=2364126 RepID=A0ABN9WCW5_9DINO|nr:unnamed protein product [Polarella glacialis]